MVLAYLEQYILLNNSSELLYGTAEAMVIEVLVDLYGFYRGLAKMNYQVPYSPEAERILFQIVAEKEWDFLSTRFHFISLTWLFQEERIYKSLSDQILKLLRCYSSFNKSQIVVHGNDGPNIDVRVIAELVASGDNFAATLLVCLLGELVEEGGQDEDIILVLNKTTIIIDMCPAATNQLCLNGIGVAIQNLYYHSSCSSSSTTITTTTTTTTTILPAISQLVFRIFRSVHSQSLTDDEAWLAVTTKVLDYLIPLISANGWTQEALILTGILSLILHHSINEALVEASKTILLNSPLVSAINNTIYGACSMGLDHVEGTMEETLIFLVLLHYFSFRSVHAILPGIVDARSLLGNEEGAEQPLSYISSIHRHYLCRLLHFGSTAVKLVASYCLLEQFRTLSEEQKRKEPDNFKCSSQYLLSAKAVLGNLIFYSDIRVAMNCALCLSIVPGWDKQEQVTGKNNWCQLIVEELAISSAVPCLASKSFMIRHMPAVHVAVSLLQLPKLYPWMPHVFDDSCISAIIQNLSVTNLTTEIVLLFRALLYSGYLKSEQMDALNRVFQGCRKRMNLDDTQDATIETHNREKVIVSSPDDLAQFAKSS